MSKFNINIYFRSVKSYAGYRMQKKADSAYHKINNETFSIFTKFNLYNFIKTLHLIH